MFTSDKFISDIILSIAFESFVENSGNNLPKSDIILPKYFIKRTLRMKKNIEKTNVMRILEQKKINYISHYYADTDAISGIEVATVLNQDSNRVFKTLVTEGKTKNNYVFLVPVCKELDLKKAAKAVGEKSINMIKSKDLLALTGYIHGGCSPIGMKKTLITTIDKTAEDFDTIIFSGGKIGFQVEISIDDLKTVIDFSLNDICSGEE